MERVTSRNHHAALMRNLPVRTLNDASYFTRHDPMRLPDVHSRRANAAIGAASHGRERTKRLSGNDDSGVRTGMTLENLESKKRKDASAAALFEREPRELDERFAPDPRRAYAQSSQTSDGPPPGIPGYVKQGNYYVPISSAEQPRTDYGGSHPYSQPAQPQRMDTRMDTREMRDPRDTPRDPRDARDHRDPRYGQDYQDPRYAYPSPATTTASLPRGEREPIAKPHQQRFADPWLVSS